MRKFFKAPIVFTIIAILYLLFENSGRIIEINDSQQLALGLIYMSVIFPLYVIIFLSGIVYAIVTYKNLKFKAFYPTLIIVVAVVMGAFLQ